MEQASGQPHGVHLGEAGPTRLQRRTSSRHRKLLTAVGCLGANHALEDRDLNTFPQSRDIDIPLSPDIEVSSNTYDQRRAGVLYYRNIATPAVR